MTLRTPHHADRHHACRFAEAQRAGRTTTRAERIQRTAAFLNSDAAAAPGVQLLNEVSVRNFINHDASFFNDFTDTDASRPTAMRTGTPASTTSTTSTILKSSNTTSTPTESGPSSKPLDSNSKSKSKFPSEAREAREADLRDSPWMGDKTQAARQAARRAAPGPAQALPHHPQAQRTPTKYESPKAWDPAHWDSSDFQRGPYFAS